MEILDYLMKELKKKKIDEAILTCGTNNSRQIKFADNKIVKTGVEELKDIGVFVVKDKKIVGTDFQDIVGETGLEGEGSGTLLDKKSIGAFVNKIMNYLKAVQPKEDYFGINSKKFKYKEIGEGYDAKVKEVDDVDLVEKGINAALKEGVKRTNGILEVHNNYHEVLTSSGVNYNEERSELYFSLRGFVKKEESGHANVVSTNVKDFDVEKGGQAAGQIASDAKNPIKGTKGKYDVIFAPLAFAPILNNIGESASIFSVESGLSFFSDQMGKRVGSESLTIYDEGNLKGGIGSSKSDAEGIPTQKTTLIDKGIYRNYLHSVNTGRKYKTESTGNGGMIVPEPWNIVVKPGLGSLDKMIKDVKNGLYVTNVWYTRFANYHTGDFSTIPRDGAFLIKNGKIVNSLKGIRISENVLNMLKNVKEVGKESVHLRSWEASTPILSPHVLIKDCNITTPTK